MKEKPWWEDEIKPLYDFNNSNVKQDNKKNSKKLGFQEEPEYISESENAQSVSDSVDS